MECCSIGFVDVVSRGEGDLALSFDQSSMSLPYPKLICRDLGPLKRMRVVWDGVTKKKSGCMNDCQNMPAFSTIETFTGP
jgi:hypothetical protein